MSKNGGGQNFFLHILKNVSCMPRWTILRNCPKSVRILRCVFHLFWQFLLKVSPLRRESIWTVFDQKSPIFYYLINNYLIDLVHFQLNLNYIDPEPSNTLCLHYFLVSSNITTQCPQMLHVIAISWYLPVSWSKCQQITFLLNAKDRMNPQQSWVPPGPHCSRVCNLVVPEGRNCKGFPGNWGPEGAIVSEAFAQLGVWIGGSKKKRAGLACADFLTLSSLLMQAADALFGAIL